MSNPRKTRVEHAIREALAELIASAVRDPRVQAAQMITVTQVELNVDLSVAKCFVSVVLAGQAKPDPLHSRGVDGVLEGLKKAAGFLRGAVAREVGLQRAPELRFVADSSLDMQEKIAAILREDEAKK